MKLSALATIRIDPGLRFWCFLLFLMTLGGCRMVQSVSQQVEKALTPGVEYYFDENPVHGYFVSQTYTTKPLTEQQAEAADYLRIGVVRQDQKIEHETTYLRKREPFPLDPAKFAAIPDGTFYYQLGAEFSLIPITLVKAIHSEDYVKVVRSSGKIISSTHVSTPSMATTQYTYYPNGHVKSSSGVNRKDSVSETQELLFDEKSGQPTTLIVNGVVQK